MTTTRTTTPIRPQRRTGPIVEGVLAAVGLVAFVVGVPVVLQIVAPISWPTTWPTWQQIWAVLSRPDDGTLFISALTLVVWVGWAWLTMSILIEVVVALTYLRIPAIPLLGLTRGAAKTLVATAGVLLTTSTSLAGSLPAHAATAIELVLPDEPTVLTGDAPAARSPQASHAVAVAQRFTPPAPTAEIDTHPVITVNHGDTLWSLAERHLGAGHRYTEILDLNLHRLQTDGRTLTPNDEHWLYDGWTLRLPMDASDLPAPVAANTDAPADAVPVVYDVVAGDTLSDIAETHFGDGARYPEIYDLNVGVPQPDGASLTDPDLIRPGWGLTLPGSDPAVDASNLISTPAGEVLAGGQGEVTGPSGLSLNVDPAEGPRPLSDVEPRTFAPVGPDLAEPPSGSRSEAVADDSAPEWLLTQLLVLGLTAIAAAGIAGELARRRARQRRLRRAGERIPQLGPLSPGERAEHALRRAEVPFTPAVLREGLHLLGPACQVVGRGLPRLVLVILSEETIELLLAEDDEDAVKPFEQVAPRTWRASLDAFASQERAEIEGFPMPYPALVSIGVTQGRVVLLNLEAAGAFAVNGPESAVDAVMRAMAMELATSDLSSGIDLVLGPEYADLVEVCPSVMVQGETSNGRLQVRLDASASDNARVLRDAQVGDALMARSASTGDATWIPSVFVGRALDGEGGPWSGQVLVTSTEGIPWRFDVDGAGNGRLEPLGLVLEPQQLSRDTYSQVVAALRVAGVDPVRDAVDTQPARDVEADAIRVVLAQEDPDVRVARDVSAGDSWEQPSDTAVDQGTSTNGSVPRVLVLGPVRIDGVENQGARNRDRRHTELITYLALNRGASSAELDEVIGHGRRIDSARRNQDVSRARGWLGLSPSGSPFLLKLAGKDKYGLDPLIRTDWDDFRDLTQRALATDQVDASLLREALELVRGRPFQGVSYNTYDWADPLIGTMIDQIVDAAHLLARVELDARNYRAVRQATALGFTADPCNEMLFRDAIEAAHRAGDCAEVERLYSTLRARIDAIDPGCDLEDTTIDLLELVRE